MRILFIGTVQSSKILLEELINMKENVVGVLTKKSSTFNADYEDLTELCIENAIDYHYVSDMNDVDSINYIKSKQPDVIYCFGLSQIIEKDILSIPKKGVIGFHPAMLPNNRGRHPIIWALVLGLYETASTFFFIDEGADTGDILSQEKIYIEYSDYAQDLYNKIMDTAKKQLNTFTKQLKEDTYNRIPQDNNMSNYWRKRNKYDGEIDWRMSSKNIYNLIRALSKPYVGAHFVVNGSEIKVWKAEEEIKDGFSNIEPGKVIEVYSSTSFLVKVGDNLIKVIDCEPIGLEEGDYLL